MDRQKKWDIGVGAPPKNIFYQIWTLQGTIFFSENLLHQKQCKYAMNIWVVQVIGAFFKIFLL